MSVPLASGPRPSGAGSFLPGLLLLLFAPLLAACNVTGAEEPGERREVILLANREGQQVVFLDAGTLETLGALTFPTDVERAGTSIDGRSLLVHVNRGNGCCEMRAVDLETHALSGVIEWPSLGHQVTGDGRYVLTQRGNVGVEVKDGETFEHLTNIGAPGGYALVPDPSGRWVAGFQNHPDPTIVFFDMDSMELAREFLRPPGSIAVGWVEGDLALIGHDEAGPALWLLDAEAESMDTARRMTLPLPFEPGREDQEYQPTGAFVSGDRLVVYHHVSWRFKISADGTVPWGVFAVDLESPTADATHLLPELGLATVLAVDEGSTLVALDTRSYGERPRIIRIDATTGALLHERHLEEGTWSLGTARIPADLVPDGAVTTVAD